MMPIKPVSQETQNENEIVYWYYLSGDWSKLFIGCTWGYLVIPTCHEDTLQKILTCFGHTRLIFPGCLLYGLLWMDCTLNATLFFISICLYSCKLLPVQMALNLSKVDVTEEKRKEAVFCRGDGFSLWLSERKRANMIFQLRLPSEFSS